MNSFSLASRAGLLAAPIRRLAVLATLAVVGSIVVAPAGVATAATWSSAGDLDLARVGHQATLLADGRVLVTGGSTTVGNTYDTKAAEIYDPATNAWSSAGMTAHGRSQGHTAARLADGKVLVAGGVEANICTESSASAPSAELWDPATGTWSATGSMALGRYFATATTLQNGKVLVAAGGNRCGTQFTQAELYDPATGTWSSTGSMNTPREWHRAVLLADGRVLVVGGIDNTLNSTDSAEIYDPSTGTWTATGSTADDRFHPSLTRLADGRVMATGGYTGFWSTAVPTGPAVEIFDPATGTWTPTGSLSVGRSGGTLSLLSNGVVLAAGGTDGATTHSTAELWDPGTGAWSSTASMAAARLGHSATVLPNGKVLAASGMPGGAAPYLTSAELYTPTATAYPRPKAASPIRISLVPAFRQCTGPGTTHAAPLAHPSCSPPELASEHLTVGTPDANGNPANSVAYLRLSVKVGNPATPEDEADNVLVLSATDIRNQSDLSDYTGELRLQTTLRMTDKLNGASGTDGGTTQDFPFSAVAACNSTSGTVGSTCDLTTTLDTLVPGMVKEGARTVTHLEDVRVYDGGADGDGHTTGDNTLFAWEGIFTP